MAFTRNSQTAPFAWFGIIDADGLGPSPIYAEDTDLELSEAATELLGEWLAADKHPPKSRPLLLKGALQCLRELEARKLWPDYVAKADDAFEAELERRAEMGER